MLTVADIDTAVVASPAIGIRATARLWHVLTKKGYSLNCNPLIILVELRGIEPYQTFSAGS